jgi:hypothetical protein
MNNTEDLRTSMPNLLRPRNVFQELFSDDTMSLNDRLMKYKEIKMVYKKTGIKPVYLFWTLVVSLIFILFGFFETELTYIIASVYPLYISIKTLQNGDREDIKQWLVYWVVYSVFINLESVFGLLLQYIPFYSFLKIVFLLILYLPQYNGALWIYEKLLKDAFIKYESHIYDFGVNVYKKFTDENKKHN